MRDQNKNDLIKTPDNRKSHVRHMQNAKPTGLVQISLIALTALMIFSYSMVQVSAVEGENTHQVQEKKQGLTAWASLQSIVADIFGSKDSDSNVPDINAQYLAWHDKKELKQIKQVNAKVKVGCKNVNFLDVQGHVLQEEIIKAASHCLVSGYENGKFYPDNHLKFGDFLYMLNNGFNKVLALNISIDSMRQLIQIEKNDSDVITNTDIAQIIKDLKPIHEQESNFDNGQQIATRGYGAYVLSNLLQLSNIQENSVQTDDNHGQNIILLSSNSDKQDTTQYESIEIQSLAHMGILREGESHITNKLDPISRENFIAWVIRVKQLQNSSIPKSVQGVTYFNDVLPTDHYSNELLLAKTMGLTSFLEVSEKGKIYIKPKQATTVYEAAIMLSQTSSLNLPKNPNDDTVLLTYQRAAEIINKLLVENTINNDSNSDSIGSANTYTAQNDPWYVESLRPIVQKITTLL